MSFDLPPSAATAADAAHRRTPLRPPPQKVHAAMSDLTRLLEQQRTDAIVSPAGCPIAVLPLLNLALVCRCLNSADLLSVYKSSRLLQSAASHPLAFAHGNRFTVDPWGVGVRCEGPSAHCGSLGQLRGALLSPRFASFRILSLSDSNHKSLCTLAASPVAPKLHALTIRVQSPTALDLSDMWGPKALHGHGLSVAALCDSPALSYLRVLSLSYARLIPLSEEGAALPPRLELLQLCAAPWNTVMRFVPDGLVSLLVPLSHLRTLIVQHTGFDGGPTTVEVTGIDDLLALATIEAAVPQLESIVWMVAVSFNELAAQMTRHKQLHPDAVWPKLTRVRTLLIRRTLYADAADLTLNPLLLFPSLTELRYSHGSNQAGAGRYHGVLYDGIREAQLTHLTHLTLSEVGPSAFDRHTGWSVLAKFDLAPVLASLPHLTELSVARLRIEHLSVFRAAPKLRKLTDLFWPVPANRVKAEEMGASFPSLTELSVRAVGLSTRLGVCGYHPLHAYVLRPALCAMPCLRTVIINGDRPRSPHEIQSPGEEAAAQHRRDALYERLNREEHEQLQIEARLQRESPLHSVNEGSQQSSSPASSAATSPGFSIKGRGGHSGRTGRKATTKQGGSSNAAQHTSTGTEDTTGAASVPPSDSAANLLFAFAAGGATGGPDGSASPFVFSPPPAFAASAAGFGSRVSPPSAPLVFAPPVSLGASPAFTVGQTAAAPFSAGTWKPAPAAGFSFAPPPASDAHAPFSAASSSFTTAPLTTATCGVAQPSASPFVFAPPPADCAAFGSNATAAGLPALFGAFNPFAPASESSATSSQSPSTAASFAPQQ